MSATALPPGSRVLHVIASLSGLHGGPSVVLRQLGAGLAAEGLLVDTAATDASGRGRLDLPLDAPVEEDGVRYRYFARQARFYSFSWPLSSWLWDHVRDYRLVHIHALFNYPSSAAAWIARRRGVPYIIRPLGVLNEWGMQNRRPGLKNLSYRWLERGLLQDAAAIHYTSEQEREEASARGLRGHAWIIPNPAAVDLSGGERPERAAGLPPNLLFLSRIDRKKGLDLLIPALALLRRAHPGVTLTIAGDGDAALTAELKEMAERLGVAPAIEWAGFVGDPAAKRRLFDGADIFVLPSYSENFGVAVVEAMAAGAPVLVAEGVGIHRDITAAGAGLAVPCDSVKIAEGLDRLLDDPALRQRFGAAGRRMARENYSLPAVCRRILEMYAAVTR